MSFWSLASLFTAGHQKLPGMPKNHQGLPGRLCINPISKFKPCVLCNHGCILSQLSLAWFLWIPVMITRIFLISCSSFHVHIPSQQPFFLIHHHDELLWVRKFWMYHWSLWHFLAFLIFPSVRCPSQNDGWIAQVFPARPSLCWRGIEWFFCSCTCWNTGLWVCDVLKILSASLCQKGFNTYQRTL